MPRKIESGLFSNPMTTPDGGVLLQQGSSEGAGQLADLSKNKFVKFLKDFGSSRKDATIDDMDMIRKAMQSSNYSNFAADLEVLLGAVQNNTGGIRSISLETNKPLPTGHELALDLASRIENMKEAEANSKVFNLTKFAQQKSQPREQRNKKKTRGNPFRVLMGKIGKLLDHGLDKRTIVKYISKENTWDDDTVEKAVKVVMDYNTKKKEKEVKREKTSSESFNLTRFAARDIDGSILDAKPDYEKRSTAELMARATWLNDLAKYNQKTPQGDGRKAASKEGVAAELKAIKSALKSRGFELNELP
jgi:hypothetical protein